MAQLPSDNYVIVFTLQAIEGI